MMMVVTPDPPSSVQPAPFQAPSWGVVVNTNDCRLLRAELTRDAERPSVGNHCKRLIC